MVFECYKMDKLKTLDSIHFYKRHQESAPLANLPLLEYKVHPVDPSTIPNCKHQYIFMIKLKVIQPIRTPSLTFSLETRVSFRRRDGVLLPALDGDSSHCNSIRLNLAQF